VGSGSEVGVNVAVSGGFRVAVKLGIGVKLAVGVPWVGAAEIPQAVNANSKIQPRDGFTALLKYKYTELFMFLLYNKKDQVKSLVFENCVKKGHFAPRSRTLPAPLICSLKFGGCP
jgi:hypothetical protein